MQPGLTIKTFDVEGGYESEVWFEIETGRFLSLHTTKAYVRPHTAEHHAETWADSKACRDAMATERRLIFA